MRLRRLAGLLAAIGCLAIPAQVRAVPGQPSRVHGLEVSDAGGQERLAIWIDGAPEYSSFTLEDPARIVIDLSDALLVFGGSSAPGTAGFVERVRYSQFAAEPQPMTRIVLDLRREAPYRIERVDQGLEVTVGAGPDPVATEPDEAPGIVSPDPANSNPAADVPGVAETQGDVAVVTYMTLSTVYVNAGRKHGLSEGDLLQVVHEGGVVGSIRVQTLSSKRAACVPVEVGSELAIGDAIALGSAGIEDAGALSYLHRIEVQPGPSGSASSRRDQGWLRSNGLRGRVGARYLAILDRTSSRQSFHQPALDLRLDGRNVGGGDLDLSVDVRTRRTYRSAPDGGASNEGRSRVYRANASWVPFDRRLSLTAGRQLSPEHPALGIFDGGSLVLRMSTWSVGVLSGSQPDEVDFGYSDAIRDHGGFVQVRSPQGSSTRWSTTIGAIASYAGSEINREYLSLQSALGAGRFSAYVSQDLDWNRDWRLEAEGQAISLNNTYATARARVAGQTSVNVGYDNRRNVRLYRDYVSPETEFDDAYRQGYWGGIDQRFARSYRLSARVKRSTGGTAGTADSWTLGAAAQWRVALRARSTRYYNELVRGWVHSAAASTQLGPSLRVEIGGGLRDETNATPGVAGQYVRWYSSLVDYALGRSWYASVSFERSTAGPEASDQIHSMINYRF